MIFQNELFSNSLTTLYKRQQFILKLTKCSTNFVYFQSEGSKKKRWWNKGKSESSSGEEYGKFCCL